MEVIYSHQAEGFQFVNILYGLFLLVLLALLVGVSIYPVRMIKGSIREKTKLPALFYVIFIGAFLILAAGIAAVGNSLYRSIAYENDMQEGDREVLQGNVELISCEEAWSRDTFVGYTVKIKVGDTLLEPADTFPIEVVERFRSDDELKITYGVIEGDGTYIWKIEVVSEND